MKTLFSSRTLAFLGLMAVVSCSSSDRREALPPIEPDLSIPDVGTTTSDMPGDMPDLDAIESRVEIDLERHLGEVAPEEVSRAYQLEGDAPFSGPVVTGRPGDWVIENDVARFLIEGDKRAMSPCPWGGTPIDAAYLAGGSDEDILGEICMLVNGSLSMRPDLFEILHDGSDGRAAVLAASGNLVINDFLNLPAMIDDFVDGLGGQIQIDMNTILPLRVTTYYVLRPGDSHLHVFTAFRNDTDERIDALPIFLVASGGDGYYFNPLSSANGFGAGGGSSTFGVALDNLPFIVFNGERASYAFAPEPDPRLPFQTMPFAGAYVIISGVAATVLGAPANELLDALTSSAEELAENESMLHVEPGGIETLEHRLFVGTGSLATMVDPIYEVMTDREYPGDEEGEVKTFDIGTIRGVVRDTNGDPVSGARVTAKRRGFRTTNQAISAPDGTFAMHVPVESYDIVARRGGMAPDGVTSANVEANADLDVGDVRVHRPARIRVDVTTPDDGCESTNGPQTLPARLTVVCEGRCEHQPTSTEADVKFHGKPAEFAAVVYGGTDGVLEAEVPPGDYRLVVSRGIEWSMWPADATETNGVPVSLAAGDSVQFDAEIARVVDTADAYAGDFHIHSISSPDSTVPYVDRVLNFAAEGVDLMVSTDHDFIADFGPTITELGVDEWIQSVVGEEITTADLGHFNAFPMEQNLAHSRGDAIDWGNGDSHTLPPAELFAQIKEHPGEQVIQMNHAGGLGLIKFAKADVLRGGSYADREKHRLPPFEGEPKFPGDTGIWSDDFTAMELMNGNSRGKFYRNARWWLTMIGRGFAPTGTAVTDTHKLYSDLGGVPRTYAFMNEDHSCGDRRYGDLTDYDAFVAEYVAAVNRGDAIGTNGPFFRVELENAAIERTAMGQTIDSLGEPVTASIELQMPEWMRVDAIDVYLNPDIDDVLTRPGELIEDPIPPTETIAVTWDEATDLQVVKTGEVEHRAWKKTIEIPLTTTEDAFVVFVVKGGTSMWPLTRTSPFAFSNPAFIDADGNGYDNPPYAALASQPPAPDELPPCVDAFCGERTPAGDGRLTPEEIIEAIRHFDCQHPSHEH